MSKTFCIGDIHGNHKALLQVLERSGFNNEEDTLIQLGDVVDGWDEAYECVETLTKVKHLIAIKGNHDDWFRSWLVMGEHPVYWLHGGDATLKSYCKHADREYYGKMGGYVSTLTFVDIPLTHQEFFNKQVLYYVDHKNRIFVHGGFNRLNYVDYTKATTPYDFYWNRDLWLQAQSCSDGQKLRTADGFSKIFIGHTTVNNWRNPLCKPLYSGGVWNLDTGAAFDGKLTIMDVDTEQYWQSDIATELYPDQRGRN